MNPTNSDSASTGAATLSMMMFPWASNIAVSLVQDNAAGRSSYHFAQAKKQGKQGMPDAKPLCRWTSDSCKGDRVTKTTRMCSPPKPPLRNNSWAMEPVATKSERGNQYSEDGEPESVSSKSVLHPPPDRLSHTPLEESHAMLVSAIMA
jgi:hypothetical protein